MDDVLKTLKSSYPRLIVTDGTWERIKSQRACDLRLDGFLRKSESEARNLLSVAPVTYEKVGRRLLHTSRRVVRRVLLLSLQYHLTGENLFAERAEAEMLAAAAFSDWNPSHFLDVGEMAAALAIGYDWLYDFLSPASRGTIESAIVEKALMQAVDGHGGRTAHNNWNSVTLGGLTLGALATAESYPDLAALTIQNTIRNNVYGLMPYAPDGVYPEGAMYWAYGTNYQVMLIAGLQSALGTDFGLSEKPGFLQTGNALLQQLGPTGAFFNFSDNEEYLEIEPAIWWFARATDRPDLTTPFSFLLEKYAASPQVPPPLSSTDRLLPLAAIWWTEEKQQSVTRPLNWYGRGPNPLAVFRSEWDNPRAMYLTLKGGSASLSHAHMDAGSFVFDAKGVRWARDLDRQDYHSLESKGVRMWDAAQDGQRWDVYRLGPFAHNTLTINGRKHVVSGAATITHFGTLPNDSAGAVVDMTAVFAGQAARVERGFLFRPDVDAVIRDEIEGLKAGDVVRWAMVTRAEVRLSENKNEAELTQNGEAVRVSLRPSVPARWEVEPADPPQNDYDAPNPEDRILVARLTAPISGRIDIRVTLTVGDEKPTSDTGLPWADLPLSEWQLPATDA